MRKSLDLTNWEAANKLVRDWDIHGQVRTLSVPDALDRWFNDREARNLSSESLRKYRRLTDSLIANWGEKLFRALSVDDVRKMREGWTLSPGTTAKQLELVRAFFPFCMSSGWID